MEQNWPIIIRKEFYFCSSLLQRKMYLFVYFIYFSSFCHTHFTSCVSYFSEMTMISSCLFSIFCYSCFLLLLKTNSTSTLLFPWFWMRKKNKSFAMENFFDSLCKQFFVRKTRSYKYEIQNINLYFSNSKIREINKIFKFNKNCF